MRKFNTSGPVNPEKHYYIERTELLKQGVNQIDEFNYFTIFAPRQTGKTTYFQQLIKKIKKERKKYYLSFKDNAKNYLDDRGNLKFNQLMERYIQYITERGGKMFTGRQYYEGIYQYNLDEFLYSYITELGGKIYPETGIGGGKVDLLIVLNDREYIVEVKANISQNQLLQAKRQLVEYLKRKGLDKGYLILYDDSVDDFDYFEDEIEDKKVYTWLIKTQFDNPSQVE